MNSELRLLPRESLFQLANRHFKKRGGNWAELIFTKTSGIVTSDVPVIYWPIFVVPQVFVKVTSAQFPSRFFKVADDMTVKPAYHLLVL